MILVEGETDVMATWQAIPPELKNKVTVVGLSGVNAWKTRYVEELFGVAKRVFVVFDNDDPYEDEFAVDASDKAWQKIRGDLGRKARRVRLPQGTNDLAEFFQAYDWAAFQVLLKKAGEPIRHYPRLDLTQDVPPTDWLIEDFLVRSEATAFIGDGGVGKSFITMAMALVVSGDEDEFLGLKVRQHGPVLYVDEENSQQLVLQRLKALGMDERHHKQLEYIWYAGVDLAREPQKLLEEAMELEPALIIVDSLSRVALGLEENSNTEMTKLIRGSLVPLARDTGAAVVFVHHTAKGDRSNARGAGSIKNAADQAISVVAATQKDGQLTNNLNIFPSKPRRHTAHITAQITGDVEKEGWARVVSMEEEVPF
jgi:KaiC/GvpD/RAD55 family RecA-like ATPase